MGDVVQLFAEGVHVCVECGATYTTRPGLEEHWLIEGHHPQSVQRERLDAAKRNEGWLLVPDDGE